MISTLPPSPEEQQYEAALNPVQEYDWKDDAIKLVCTGDVPNHEAYGMSFGDYKNRRNSIHTSEDDESIRICFRMTRFLTSISVDLSTLNSMSHYRFIILALELGLIHFQHRYHEDFGILKGIKASNIYGITDSTTEAKYSTLNNYTISTNSERSARSLTPTVPQWLGNAIKDNATNLNMSTSEFAFLCWCIGVSSTVTNLQPYIKTKIETYINKFDIDFNTYMSVVKSVSKDIKNLK